ncbi:MAG: adenylate/guanylate cyclase domain-containing protein [Nitriliruptorales bacterium]
MNEIGEPQRSIAPEVPSDASGAETVDELVALGIDEAEARAAVDEGRVPLVLVRQFLGEEKPHTLTEVAEKGGVEERVLRRVFVALGVPLEDSFGEGDVAEARHLRELLETLSEDSIVRLARVRGRSVARIAMGDLSAVRDEIVAPMREEGADDLDVAIALSEAAEALHPKAAQLLVHAYERALLHVLSGELATAATRGGTQELDVAVGFVDLVGYTALSAQADPSGLAAVLDAFEERVFDVTGSAPGVEVVKFVGDAAMLVARDVLQLAHVLVRVTRRTDALEDAPLRAGLAAGTTLAREGDYFGPPVNVAARLTDQARPWSVLADGDLEGRLAAAFDTSRIRPVRLRGLGFQRPVAVRPRER